MPFPLQSSHKARARDRAELEHYTNDAVDALNELYGSAVGCAGSSFLAVRMIRESVCFRELRPYERPAGLMSRQAALLYRNF